MRGNPGREVRGSEKKAAGVALQARNAPDDERACRDYGEGCLLVIVDLLRQVPDVVWAALIAAGVAFLTTTLSNRNSRNQLQMQLDHSARERDRDRAMALRREVYLPAFEAVARAQGAFGQAANPDVDLTAVGTQLLADLATMSKVHLIASEATIRGLFAFQRALMPAYFELLTRRTPIMIRRAAIATHQHLIDSALADQQRFVQMLQQLNLAGSTDAGARERINAQFAAAQNTFTEHADKQAALNREQIADQLSLTARLTELMPVVTEFIPETLVAARKELELPLDPVEYRRLFQETQQEAQRALYDLIQQLRRQTGATDRPGGDPLPPA